ncbi:YueH family protein [Staphylococcus saccharolyticus]|uniref:YueH family protein n=1 Tax=Staphylococcus saccharolyticus TaxID=33028 RepID=UPI00102DD18E|nr:YueH family protein [Staphylococcus saccharolyticus]MBL7572874.1 YueH family protein [Staphylococcus saccharolyticus]MBL7584189.1 YueH family protein [Staphylococcus saccharolyticus]MBL7638492.1 YueH family protein [Staphylococcus saccharolyticus]QRJ68009.1 YueH family protein [Staphylococcus saccharolyticus]TAA93410.1 hypothetical protein DMB74_02040 [Staphylococcus saccharolyticus]
MKIKTLQCNGIGLNVYFYRFKKKNLLMLAIPELFWSIELPTSMEEKNIQEELVMQFFNLYTENEADALARDITKWIITD